MAEIDLFQAALGLPEPWRVVGAEFSADRKRLDLYLDFSKGSRFACPQGDAAACAVHDTSKPDLAAPGLLPAPGLPARPGAQGQLPDPRGAPGQACLGAARKRLHAAV